MDGSQTSAVLDGAYTTVGGYYSVNVYAVLSLEEGEYAQRMASGPKDFTVAKPEVQGIRWGGKTVTDAYRYYRMGSGSSQTTQTYRIDVSASVDNVIVSLDGTDKGSFPVTHAGSEHYAEVKLTMQEGKHTIGAYLPDGTSYKETHLAVITYVEETIVYAQTGGASLRGWPSAGSATVRTLEESAEAVLRGMCAGYGYIRVDGKDYFVSTSEYTDAQIIMIQPEYEAVKPIEVPQEVLQPGWNFVIQETSYEVFLNVLGSGIDSGEYYLVVKYTDTTTTKTGDTIEVPYVKRYKALLSITGPEYRKQFRLEADLKLEKGRVYEFAVVSRDEVNDPTEYPFSYAYGMENGILSPYEGEAVKLWNTGSLTVQWYSESDATKYQLMIEFTYKVNGKDVTKPVYLQTFAAKDVETEYISKLHREVCSVTIDAKTLKKVGVPQNETIYAKITLLTQ